MKLMASARKQGLFLAVKDKMTALARKRGVFMAAERAEKKETPSKGCLHNYLAMRCPISVGHDVIAVLVIASLPA